MNCTRCGCPPEAHAVLMAENERELGNDAFEMGQYDVAIVRYSKALQAEPGTRQHHAATVVSRALGQLYSNRAAVFLAQGRYREALSDAERAIQIEPEWAKARARKVRHDGAQCRAG
eukprot:scaffold1522_cov340-Prasinococcus_capsulatus_cf.AAC.6